MFLVAGIFALVVSLGIVSVENQSSGNSNQNTPVEQVKK